MSSIISNHIVPRISQIPYIVVDPTVSVVKTVVGVAASALSVATLSKIRVINEKAKNMTDKSTDILPQIFRRLIRVINPNSAGKFGRNGSISGRITQPILNAAFKKSIDPSRINKHVVSRLSYTLYGVASTVTRIVELPFGLLMASSAILTLGKFEKINTLALKNLTVFGAISDICLAIRHTVNPNQES